METYATKLLQEAFEIKGTAFWKVFLENIDRELKLKRKDLENVQPDRLQNLQGWIAGLRFVLGDSRKEGMKSLFDRIVVDLQTSGDPPQAAPKE